MALHFPPAQRDERGSLGSPTNSARQMPFGGRLPPVIGHRGAAACAPENTLAGLRQAKELGCRWVEFDVRLTRDGKLILLHDERLERTTDGRGKAIALPLATIRRFDAGCRFSSSFRGEQVPTFAEAVAVLGELGLGANVELKAAHDRGAETGALASSMLRQLWPRHLPEPLVSSFDHEALAGARAGDPEVVLGLLFNVVPKNWRRMAETLGCSTIHANHQRLHPALVADIRDAGYPVLAYTVNDPLRARTLYSWGVTSVFSDVPHIVSGDATGSDGHHLAANYLNPTAGSRQGTVS
jgi:glycerophosphoryl diester phosphodiesterase